jgi:hypothetical protein
MCDVATSVMLGALSLLPDNRYLLLAFASALSIGYAVNAQRPTQKLCEVDRAIRVCGGILERAKSACARDHVELTDRMRRLFE